MFIQPKISSVQYYGSVHVHVHAYSPKLSSVENFYQFYHLLLLPCTHVQGLKQSVLLLSWTQKSSNGSRTKVHVAGVERFLVQEKF